MFELKSWCGMTPPGAGYPWVVEACQMYPFEKPENCTKLWMNLAIMNTSSSEKEPLTKRWVWIAYYQEFFKKFCCHLVLWQNSDWKRLWIPKKLLFLLQFLFVIFQLFWSEFRQWRRHQQNSSTILVGFLIGTPLSKNPYVINDSFHLSLLFFAAFFRKMILMMKEIIR